MPHRFRISSKVSAFILSRKSCTRLSILSAIYTASTAGQSRNLHQTETLTRVPPNTMALSEIDYNSINYFRKLPTKLELADDKLSSQTLLDVFLDLCVIPQLLSTCHELTR